MMAVLQLQTMKLVAIGSLAISLCLLVWATASNPQSLAARWNRSYIAHLERMLRSMFMQTKGSHIVLGQLFACVVTVGYAVSENAPMATLALPIIGYGPTWYIKRLRAERVQAIEANMDGFVLTLANALKTTPNIGTALGYAQAISPSPINSELALALKEMRVGSTVEQALLNMAARIGSTQLDAVLAGLLIGRQVGGNVTGVLETTAKTLREMARLYNLLRAKTSDGRIQVVVLTCMPLVVVVLFEWAKPGYFNPLMSSLIGMACALVAGLLWAGAVVLAYRFLKVNL